TDHVNPSMVDLLRLRRLANQALNEPFAATTGGDHDRLGREDDLVATVRRADTDGLDPLAVPMWSGVPAENPVVVIVAQCLDKTTLGKAGVSQSHRTQTGRHDESIRQRGSR